MRQSPRQAIRTLCALALALALHGCGGSGEGSDGNKKTSNEKTPLPEDPETPTKYETNVGLSLMDPDPPRLAGCGKPVVEARLAHLDGFVGDGRFDEWSQAFRFSHDRDGDGQTGSELRASYLGFHGETNPDLVGFLAGELVVDAGRQLNLSFGYLGEHRQDEQRWIGPLVKRTYRLVEGGILEEKIGDAWQPLDAAVAGWRGGQLGIEWWINRRQLDEVLLQPLWFHKIDAVEGNTVVDTLAQRYAPALDTTASSAFHFSSCGSDTSAIFPMLFQQISEVQVDQDAAEILFGIVRLAYESLQLSWSHELWPSQLLTVVISASPPIEDHASLGADHRRSLYEGMVIQWSQTLAEELRFGRYHNIFSRVQLMLIQGLLKHHRPAANLGELAWISESINQWTMRRYLGYGGWLDMLPNSIAAYTRFSDAGEPMGLKERYDRLGEPFPSPKERQTYLAQTLAKTAGAAALSSLHLDPGQMIQAWRDASARGDLLRALEKVTGDSELVAALWQGWLDNASYENGWDPSVLEDYDHDGLLNFIEATLGSDPEMVDTDEDGWSDYGEFLIGSPYNNRSKVPGVIVADGYFGDWQELLPTRIQAHDSNVNSDIECGPQTKIQATVAIGHESELILAALPEQGWTGAQPVSWEFQVNFLRQDRQLIFRVTSGQYAMVVIDAESMAVLARIPVAVPASYHATELSIDTRKFGIATDLSRRRAIRYRLTTIWENGERLLCDQTPWLFPLAHASP